MEKTDRLRHAIRAVLAYQLSLQRSEECSDAKDREELRVLGELSRLRGQLKEETP